VGGKEIGHPRSGVAVKRTCGDKRGDQLMEKKLKTPLGTRSPEDERRPIVKEGYYQKLRKKNEKKKGDNRMVTIKKAIREGT